MKSIKLTKKDIKQITESCVKIMLKEDFYQNNMNNQYDNDEEEFETDNEPYFSQQDNHRNIIIYLNNICKEIGGSADYYDGHYVIDEKEDLIQIILSFNPNNGELYMYDMKIAKNIGNEIPETINAFNWGSKALTLLSTKPFKAQ